jgi:hypothetical protein
MNRKHRLVAKIRRITLSFDFYAVFFKRYRASGVLSLKSENSISEAVFGHFKENAGRFTDLDIGLLSSIPN